MSEGAADGPIASEAVTGGAGGDCAAWKAALEGDPTVEGLEEFDPAGYTSPVGMVFPPAACGYRYQTIGDAPGLTLLWTNGEFEQVYEAVLAAGWELGPDPRDDENGRRVVFTPPADRPDGWGVYLHTGQYAYDGGADVRVGDSWSQAASAT